MSLGFTATLSVLRASEDVEDAFSALVNREQQQRTLADGAKSLMRAQQSSMAAYKGGVVSLIEVLNADTRLNGWSAASERQLSSRWVEQLESLSSMGSATDKAGGEKRDRAATRQSSRRAGAAGRWRGSAGRAR